MTAPTHADPSSKLRNAEPVMVTAVAVWIVQIIGTLIVSRYHIITPDQWSAVSVELTSLVSGAILLGAGWLVRQRVSPVGKPASENAPTPAPAQAPPVVNVTLPAAPAPDAAPAPVAAPLTVTDPAAPLDGLPVVLPPAEPVAPAEPATPAAQPAPSGATAVAA